MKRKIQKLLVANRGASAVRIIHTCRYRKIEAITVYSSADRLAHHVFLGESAVHIGEPPPIESYLNMDNIISAAKQNKVDAIHPGWGFLAENHVFAQMVIDEGFIWIGPSPKVIELMGNKADAKKVARDSNVPTIPGLDVVNSPADIKEWIKNEKISYPILLKAVAGGGGKGMVKVNNVEEIEAALTKVRSEAGKAFGNSAVLVEKYIKNGKHIEVQIVADEHCNIVHLFERECTIQRRNQKIVEEAPSSALNDKHREKLFQTAIRLMRKIGYTSAGTVEFFFDVETKEFYFIEVNTRLQVEHGITELITGRDIVGIMLDVAMGEKLPFKQPDIKANRWALEVRINAEDPKTFNPSFGSISHLKLPQGPNVRVISGVYEGETIPPYYDSLLCLLMTAGTDRLDAIKTMDQALSKSVRIEGIKSLTPLLLSIIRHPLFISGKCTTSFIEDNLTELISRIKETSGEDEVLKIARYLAERSAVGPKVRM
ncbi:MAG: acetyl-CoA carboxylase biotin carboxylase subunit [Candidatus Anammoxibacter sp.]